jgi:hypothetical protein
MDMEHTLRLEQDGDDTVRHVSGTMVYGECLHNGRFLGYLHSVCGRPYYQGEEDPMKLPWIGALYGRLPMEAFELELDGRSFHTGWVNPVERGIVARYVGLYKSFCHSVITDCRVFHHTPGLRHATDEPWCALEYAAQDGGTGYAAVFKLLPGAGEYRLRLRGVKPGTMYRVTTPEGNDGFTASGHELRGAGVPVGLNGALASALLLYREVGP